MSKKSTMCSRLLGIPKPVIALILCMTMILVYLLGFVFSLCGIILYIPCYFLSREDPDLLMIALDSLFQLDCLEG
jgi:type IV secretory pathway VirB3-like protein